MNTMALLTSYAMRDKFCFVLLVNGNFTEWSPWTNCTESCGGGTRERNRTCNNPKPQHGGLNCVGPHYANESCNVHECPSKYFTLKSYI